MTQAISGAPEKGKLPTEIHAQLVETLFGTPGSFVAGMVGGLIVPIIAWARTRGPEFLVCTAVLLLFCGFRVAVYLAHRKARPADRLAAAGFWEKLYAVAAIGFMLTVGVAAALMVRHHGDELTPLYGVALALGCVTAAAGRNAGRPMIVYAQVLGLCAPLAVVLMMERGVWSWGLAGVMVLVMVGAKSMTRFLNDMLVSALLNGREARIQRGRFSSALDSMTHGLCMGDAEGRITVLNHRLREFFRLPDDLGELSVNDLARRIAIAGRMPREEQDIFERTWETHVTHRDSGVFSETLDGRIYDFRCEPMDMGGFVVVVEDVTETRLASREIERMAHFDSLTGLPNRIQFHERLSECLKRPLKPGHQITLVSIDLDQFKEVNDTKGHPTGDELLCLVSKRLRNCIQGADMVARFGGDEFQLLLQTPADDETVGKIAQRIIDTLSASYRIDANSINIGASIGMAVSPRDSDDADELLRCADMALYRAKADGRGVFRFYDRGMDKAMQRKREVAHYLREAIANEELDVHYQPVVDARTGQVVACEALARLKHPTEGLISPAEFIHVAEETGQIVQLGEWVLRRACSDAVHWPKHIRVAVNFSAKQFVMGKDIVGDIKIALDMSGLPADRLEVEITESTIFEAKDALAQLRDISALGAKISLDDFGTGYSSLSYLRQFPVDKIKIDRSFAQDVKSRESQAVIGSVSVLAQLLSVDLVIEGIEKVEQLDAVKPWNVRLIQGYLFSRPLPLAELESIIMRDAPFAPAKDRKVA